MSSRCTVPKNLRGQKFFTKIGLGTETSVGDSELTMSLSEDLVNEAVTLAYVKRKVAEVGKMKWTPKAIRQRGVPVVLVP